MLGVWETYRGNGWDNRGLERFSVAAGGHGDVVTVEARVLAKREFYEQRAKCRVSLSSLCFYHDGGHDFCTSSFPLEDVRAAC